MATKTNENQKLPFRYFEKDFKVHFGQADPAGILFFGNIFTIAHECFEEFIQVAGFTWKDWFTIKEYMVPIRHTECNYLKPFLPGETYHIRATVAKIGATSFQMKYVFSQGEAQHAEVKMTHAFMDTKTRQKTAVPEIIREKLKVYIDANV